MNNSQIKYGSFVTAIIQFLLIALAVYFFIVMPLNRLEARRKRRRGIPDAPATETELELLAQIRDALVASGNGSGSRPGSGPDRF